jgi:hypothetical protein
MSDAITLTMKEMERQRKEMEKQKMVIVGKDATVYTGIMPVWGQILSANGDAEKLTDFNEMSYRGLWSYLRLQLGKRRADLKINEVRAPWKEQLEDGDITLAQYRAEVFEEMKNLIDEITNLRKVQFIMRNDVPGSIYATASTKHLLIPKDIVMETIKRVIPESAYSADLGVATASLEQLGGLQDAFDVQFHLDPGNILTRKAIRVGFGLRIKSCMNPLTFINAGGLDRFFDRPTFGYSRGRVLRIDRPANLDARIMEAYEASKDATELMKNDIENAKKTPLELNQARVLGAAFPVAFGAGSRVVKQIQERYTAEDSTLWGLAMAVSYVARHGEKRKDATSLSQNLANAAAGYLWIKDLDSVIDKSYDWLKNVKKVDLGDYL